MGVGASLVQGGLPAKPDPRATTSRASTSAFRAEARRYSSTHKWVSDRSAGPTLPVIPQATRSETNRPRLRPKGRPPHENPRSQRCSPTACSATAGMTG